MMDFLQSHINETIIIALAVVVVILIIIIIGRAGRSVSKKAYSAIKHGRAVSAEVFLEEWSADKNDYPGCYVILAYKRRIIHNFLRYDAVYVGQSVNVRKRVHSHLSGRGNGEVFHLIRDGYHIFIHTVKCKEKKLNQTEKDLIAAFCATESINATAGGAAVRK